jgi:pimeloyl-ACP methyl ester carboxylesterase
MKTKIAKRGGHSQVAALGAALVLLTLAAGSALAGSSSHTAKRPDPYTKGATRLMERPAPELLPSELGCLELAEPHTNWTRLLREAQVFRCPTVRSNHTVHVAIHRMNQNPRRPVLIMIHGVLSDYSMWEYVTPELGEDYEIWLVDLPGCGKSDGPKPSSIEPDGYSPTGMAERLLQAVEQQLADEPPGSERPLILVGHSLGSTVCIRLMSAPELRSHYAPVVDRVEGMVLFAPGDLAINSVPAKFRKLLGLEGWMVDVARGLGAWNTAVRDLIKSGYHRPECATVERQICMAHILEDGGHLAAAKAMLRQFTPFDPKTKRPLWPEIDQFVADYKNIRVPLLIVHGVWDETLPVATAHKLKNQVPGAWLVEVAHGGHSLPTELPARCTDLIRQFVATGVVRVSDTSDITVYPGSAPLPASLVGNYPLGIPANWDSLDTRAKERLP